MAEYRGHGTKQVLVGSTCIVVITFMELKLGVTWYYCFYSCHINDHVLIPIDPKTPTEGSAPSV